MRSPKKPPSERNVHAVILGRAGGRLGGIARAKKMSPAERSASASKAAQARWESYRREP